MEELLSTDNIHREILDDAARKAGKLLKGAETAVASISSEWDAKLQKTIAEVKARYDAEIAEKKSEATARLAVDKARAKLTKVTGELEHAMRGFFQALPRNEALAILEHALSLRLANVKAAGDLSEAGGRGLSRLRVETYGLSEAETGALLAGLSVDVSAVAAATTPIEAIKAHEAIKVIETHELADGELPSIIILTDDIKITASLQAEADAILLEKRSEAAEALFG
jgi:hypothetical protein